MYYMCVQYQEYPGLQVYYVYSVYTVIIIIIVIIFTRPTLFDITRIPNSHISNSRCI